MSLKRGLVLAMEEEALMVADEPLLAEPEVAAQTAETDIVDAVDLGGEVTDQLDAVDEASDAGDELGEIADALQTAADNGGMDETSARVVEVAVEGIYKRLGVRKQAKMPAMESFKSDTSRIQATKIAIEGIKETLAAIWKAIVDAVIKMTAWIKAFVAKLFDANGKLGERAKKLGERLGSLKEEKAKEGVVSGSFVSALVHAGKLDTPSLIKGLKGLDTAVKAMPAFAKNAEEFLNEFGNADKLITDKAAFDAADFGVPHIPGFAAVSKSDGFADAAEGVGSYRGAELPGNKALILVTATDVNLKGEASIKGLKATKFYLGSFNPKAPKAEVKDVPTLSKQSMEAVLAEVTAITASVAAAKASIDKVTSARDKFVADIKKITVAAGADAETAARAKAMQAVASAGNRVTAEFVSTTNRAAVMTSKAALDYVEKSMAQYAVPKAA